MYNILVQLNYWITFLDVSECPSTSGSMSNGAGPDGTLISVIYKWDNRRNLQFQLVQCILQYFCKIKLSDYVCRCFQVLLYQWLHVQRRRSGWNIDFSGIQVE
jgi:hypothetical protein